MNYKSSPLTPLLRLNKNTSTLSLFCELHGSLIFRPVGPSARQARWALLNKTAFTNLRAHCDHTRPSSQEQEGKNLWQFYWHCQYSGGATWYDCFGAERQADFKPNSTASINFATSSVTSFTLSKGSLFLDSGSGESSWCPKECACLKNGIAYA